jgi:uncharacterized protein (DUF1778 family)
MKKVTKSAPKIVSTDPHPMSIRFTAQERQLIDRSATRDGLKFGSWVRQIAVLSAKQKISISRSVEMKGYKVA